MRNTRLAQDTTTQSDIGNQVKLRHVYPGVEKPFGVGSPNHDAGTYMLGLCSGGPAPDSRKAPD